MQIDGHTLKHPHTRINTHTHTHTQSLRHTHLSHFTPVILPSSLIVSIVCPFYTHTHTHTHLFHYTSQDTPALSPCNSNYLSLIGPAVCVCVWCVCGHEKFNQACCPTNERSALQDLFVCVLRRVNVCLSVYY